MKMDSKAAIENKLKDLQSHIPFLKVTIDRLEAKGNPERPESLKRLKCLYKFLIEPSIKKIESLKVLEKMENVIVTLRQTKVKNDRTQDGYSHDYKAEVQKVDSQMQPACLDFKNSIKNAALDENKCHDCDYRQIFSNSNPEVIFEVQTKNNLDVDLRKPGSFSQATNNLFIKAACVAVSKTEDTDLRTCTKLNPVVCVSDCTDQMCLSSSSQKFKSSREKLARLFGIKSSTESKEYFGTTKDSYEKLINTKLLVSDNTKALCAEGNTFPPSNPNTFEAPDKPFKNCQMPLNSYSHNYVNKDDPRMSFYNSEKSDYDWRSLQSSSKKNINVSTPVILQSLNEKTDSYGTDTPLSPDFSGNDTDGNDEEVPSIHGHLKSIKEIPLEKSDSHKNGDSNGLERPLSSNTIANNKVIDNLKTQNIGYTSSTQSAFKPSKPCQKKSVLDNILGCENKYIANKFENECSKQVASSSALLIGKPVRSVVPIARNKAQSPDGSSCLSSSFLSVHSGTSTELSHDIIDVEDSDCSQNINCERMDSSTLQNKSKYLATTSLGAVSNSQENALKSLVSNSPEFIKLGSKHNRGVATNRMELYKANRERRLSKEFNPTLSKNDSKLTKLKEPISVLDVLLPESDSASTANSVSSFLSAGHTNSTEDSQLHKKNCNQQRENIEKPRTFNDDLDFQRDPRLPFSRDPRLLTKRVSSEKDGTFGSSFGESAKPVNKGNFLGSCSYRRPQSFTSLYSNSYHGLSLQGLLVRFHVTVSSPVQPIFAQAPNSVIASTFTCLLAKGLPPYTTSVHIYQFFDQFILRDMCIEVEQNYCKGTAYIHFPNHISAENALKSRNGCLLNGYQIHLRICSVGILQQAKITYEKISENRERVLGIPPRPRVNANPFFKLPALESLNKCTADATCITNIERESTSTNKSLLESTKLKNFKIPKLKTVSQKPEVLSGSQVKHSDVEIVCSDLKIPAKNDVVAHLDAVHKDEINNDPNSTIPDVKNKNESLDSDNNLSVSNKKNRRFRKIIISSDSESENDSKSMKTKISLCKQSNLLISSDSGSEDQTKNAKAIWRKKKFVLGKENGTYDINKNNTDDGNNCTEDFDARSGLIEDNIDSLSKNVECKAGPSRRGRKRKAFSKCESTNKKRAKRKAELKYCLVKKTRQSVIDTTSKFWGENILKVVFPIPHRNMIVLGKDTQIKQKRRVIGSEIDNDDGNNVKSVAITSEDNSEQLLSKCTVDANAIENSSTDGIDCSEICSSTNENTDPSQGIENVELKVFKDLNVKDINDINFISSDDDTLVIDEPIHDESMFSDNSCDMSNSGNVPEENLIVISENQYIKDNSEVSVEDKIKFDTPDLFSFCKNSKNIFGNPSPVAENLAMCNEIPLHTNTVCDDNSVNLITNNLDLPCEDNSAFDFKKSSIHSMNAANKSIQFSEKENIHKHTLINNFLESSDLMGNKASCSTNLEQNVQISGYIVKESDRLADNSVKLECCHESLDTNKYKGLGTIEQPIYIEDDDEDKQINDSSISTEMKQNNFKRLEVLTLKDSDEPLSTNNGQKMDECNILLNTANITKESSLEKLAPHSAKWNKIDFNEASDTNPPLSALEDLENSTKTCLKNNLLSFLVDNNSLDEDDLPDISPIISSLSVDDFSSNLPGVDALECMINTQPDELVDSVEDKGSFNIFGSDTSILLSNSNNVLDAQNSPKKEEMANEILSGFPNRCNTSTELSSVELEDKDNSNMYRLDTEAPLTNSNNELDAKSSPTKEVANKILFDDSNYCDVNTEVSSFINHMEQSFDKTAESSISLDQSKEFICLKENKYAMFTCNRTPKVILEKIKSNFVLDLKNGNDYFVGEKYSAEGYKNKISLNSNANIKHIDNSNENLNAYSSNRGKKRRHFKGQRFCKIKKGTGDNSVSVKARLKKLVRSSQENKNVNNLSKSKQITKLITTPSNINNNTPDDDDDKTSKHSKASEIHNSEGDYNSIDGNDDDISADQRSVSSFGDDISVSSDGKEKVEISKTKKKDKSTSILGMSEVRRVTRQTLVIPENTELCLWDDGGVVDLFQCDICDYVGRHRVSHLHNFHAEREIPCEIKREEAHSLFKDKVSAPEYFVKPDNIDLSWIPCSMTFETEIACIDDCGYTSNSRFDLIYHYLEHEKEAITLVYHCRLCNYMSEKLEEFYNHVSSHTGEYRYKCELCGQSFFAMQAMENHFGMYHESQAVKCNLMDMILEDGWPYIYVCKVCLFVRIELSLTEMHVIKKHGGKGEIYKANMSRSINLFSGKADKRKESKGLRRLLFKRKKIKRRKKAVDKSIYVSSENLNVENNLNEVEYLVNNYMQFHLAIKLKTIDDSPKIAESLSSKVSLDKEYDVSESQQCALPIISKDCDENIDKLSVDNNLSLLSHNDISNITMNLERTDVDYSDKVDSSESLDELLFSPKNFTIFSSTIENLKNKISSEVSADNSENDPDSEPELLINECEPDSNTFFGIKIKSDKELYPEKSSKVLKFVNSDNNCILCLSKKIFKSGITMDHIYQIHGRFVCTDVSCLYTTKERQSYIDHVFTCHTECKEMMCSLCDNTFLSLNDMTEHFQVFHPTVDNSSDLFLQNDDDEGNIKIASVTTLAPNKNNNIIEGFSDTSSVSNKSINPSTAYPFLPLEPPTVPLYEIFTQCCYCLISYAVKEKLVSHIIEEHGHCYLQCSYCLYRSNSNVFISVHLKNFHPQFKQLYYEVPVLRSTPPEPPPTHQFIRRYKCLLCCETPTAFETVDPEFFKMHVHRTHGKDTAVNCAYCGQIGLVEPLIEHMRSHQMNEYQCPYCFYGELEREKLLNHLLNCHPGQPGKVLIRRQSSSSSPSVLVSNTSSVQQTPVPKNVDRDNQSSFIHSTSENKDRSKNTETEGLCGENLYRCGNIGCDSCFVTMFDLREHLLVCDFSRDCPLLRCYHCDKQVRHVSTLIDHLKVHGPKRYICGIEGCTYRAAMIHYFKNHMKQSHQCSVFKHISKDITNNNPETQEFLVYPKDHSIVPLHKKRKNEFSIDDIERLPKNHILSQDAKCYHCSYSTKTRTNMIKHLHLHKKFPKAVVSPSKESKTFLSPVPYKVPINPVPRFDRKELMFDKMMNLAGSSFEQKKKKVDGDLRLQNPIPPGELEKLPEFIPEERLNLCGIDECKYLSCDETMLKYHIKTLHSNVSLYSCPHCKDFSLSLEKIKSHFQLHGEKLFRCGWCPYLSCKRPVVERHCKEKHSGKRTFDFVIRDPIVEATKNNPTENTQEDEQPPEETVKKSNEKPQWQCGLCSFNTSTMQDIVNHTTLRHDIKSQYKCGYCSVRSSARLSFDAHFAAKHPDKDFRVLCMYYRIDSDDIEPFQSGNNVQEPEPIWKRNDPNIIKNIRGILIEGDEDLLDQKVLPDLGICEPFQNYYVCPKCNTFRTPCKSTFQAHLCKELNYHRYECSQCGSTKPMLSSIRSHFAKCHHPLQFSQSSYAALPTEDEFEAVVDSVISHQKQLIDKWSESDKIEESSKGMIIHNSRENNRFTCTVCAFECRSAAGLKSHTTAMHFGRFKCHYCPFSSSTDAGIKQHCEIRHPKQPVKVLSVSEEQDKLDQDTLPEVTKLRKIVKSISQRQYNCHYCEFSASSAMALTRHRSNKHKFIFKYKCNYCSRKFVRLGAANKHKCLSTDAVPSISEYSFTSESKLPTKKSKGEINSRPLTALSTESADKTSEGKNIDVQCCHCSFKENVNEVEYHMTGRHSNLPYMVRKFENGITTFEEYVYHCNYCNSDSESFTEAKNHWVADHIKLDFKFYRKLVQSKLISEEPSEISSASSAKNKHVQDRNEQLNRSSPSQQAAQLSTSSSDDIVYKCSNCKRSSTIKEEIVQHQKTHHVGKVTSVIVLSKELYHEKSSNILECNYCGLKCTRNLFAIHCTKAHPGCSPLYSVVQVKETVYYRCELCYHVTKGCRSIKQHIQRNHPNENLESYSIVPLDTSKTPPTKNILKCNYCGDAGATLSDLEDHHQFVHSHLPLSITNILDVALGTVHGSLSNAECSEVKVSCDTDSLISANLQCTKVPSLSKKNKARKTFGGSKMIV